MGRVVLRRAGAHADGASVSRVVRGIFVHMWVMAVSRSVRDREARGSWGEHGFDDGS